MDLIMKSFNGVVIIDAGHGPETPGKRSPIWSDGKQLLEYEMNRKIALIYFQLLEAEGVKTKFVFDMNKDTSLSTRVRRADKIYEEHPDSFLVSIHCNAGGGTGWECFTSKGNTESDSIASYFCYEAEKTWPNKQMRFDWSDGDPDKEEDFYVLTRTKCPAVLTENFFMDNEEDCRYLLHPESVIDIAEMHFRATMDYIKEYGNN